MVSFFIMETRNYAGVYRSKMCFMLVNCFTCIFKWTRDLWRLPNLSKGHSKFFGIIWQNTYSNWLAFSSNECHVATFKCRLNYVKDLREIVPDIWPFPKRTIHTEITQFCTPPFAKKLECGKSTVKYQIYGTVNLLKPQMHYNANGILCSCNKTSFIQSIISFRHWKFHQVALCQWTRLQVPWIRWTTWAVQRRLRL